MRNAAGSIALLVTTLTFAACASAGTPGTTSAPSVASSIPPVGVWQLEQLGDAAPTAEAPITARFGADGSLSGSSGCNRFTGRYEVSGNTITVAEPLASTMMACDEAVMAQEAAFLAALQGVQTFELDGESLTLTGRGEDLVFGAQSQDLAGTDWTVTSYNTGTGAVSSVLAGTTATVTFAADGKVSGSGGCNRFTGAWSAEGGQLKISSLASTRMACADPAGVMEQEAALLKALESAATYSVEGGVLDIRTTDGATAAQLARA